MVSAPLILNMSRWPIPALIGAHLKSKLHFTLLRLKAARVQAGSTADIRIIVTTAVTVGASSGNVYIGRRKTTRGLWLWADLPTTTPATIPPPQASGRVVTGPILVRTSRVHQTPCASQEGLKFRFGSTR